MSAEAILSKRWKIFERAGLRHPESRWGELTALPRPITDGQGAYSSPPNPNPTLGLRPWQPPQQSSFPQCLGGLDSVLTVTMQNFGNKQYFSETFKDSKALFSKNSFCYFSGTLTHVFVWSLKELVEMRALVLEVYLLQRSLFFTGCFECSLMCHKLASIRLE